MSIVEGVGVWAAVNWTQRGADYVTTREYRYLSPVVLVRKKDSRAVELHSVALTNKPAIVGMVPIVNKEPIVLDNERLERTRWFLNLAETATAEEIMSELETFLSQLRTMAGAASDANQATVVAALKEKLDAGDKFKVAVCKALKIADDTKTEEVVVAINKAAEKPAPATDAVPKSQHEEQLAAHKQTIDKQDERIKALEQVIQANKRAAFIDRGMKAGKIIEAHRSMWERSFDADAGQAEKDLDAAQQIAPAEGRLTGAAHGSGNASRETDPILAHADKFDSAGMDAYRRAKGYQGAHKCTFEEALKHVG